MGFVDKIIEKAENKIQKIKKKREQKMSPFITEHLTQKKRRKNVAKN